MRERFDFSRISSIILENSKHDNFNKEYFYLLFDYAFSQDEIKISVTDESNISRILKGERNVPKDIVSVYQNAGHKKYLKEGVSKFLEEIFDVTEVKQQIYDLLMGDVTLSKSMRNELGIDRDDNLRFLTNCIFAGLTRNNVKRKQAGKQFDFSDYLLDYHYPRGNKAFFGRDRELYAIHQILSVEPCVFLHGIGGIGKSELAIHYGKKFEKEYGNILFLCYTESLYRTICELGFIDDEADMSEKELFEMHIRFIKQLDADTLVIVDNFNKLLEDDEVLQDFLSMPFQLLVTTRSKIDEAVCYPIKEIESLDALEELFYTYAPAGKTSENIVQNIIEEVYRYILTVEIAAKTVSAADLTPIELLKALRTDRLNISSLNKVRVQKDAAIKKATPKEHLTRLFQLQNLPDEHMVVLQHMRLIPAWGIPKRLFHKWIEAADFNLVNDLISYGWLQENEETCRISMHSFLNEVLGMFHNPSFHKCQRFIENLGQEYVAGPENEIFYRDLLGLTKSIFQTIQIDDTFLEFQLLEKILAYVEKYMYYNTMEYMLELFKSTIPMGAEHKKETATYQFYYGVKILGNGELETATKCFLEGIFLLEPVDKSDAELAINLYHKLAACYMLGNNTERYQNCMKKVIELRELYGCADPADYEFEKLMLTLASQSNTSMELEEVFQIPEVSSFMKKVGNFSISQEEFQTDIEKVVPDELSDDISHIFEEIKEELMNMDFSKQEEISAFDLMMGVFGSVANCMREKD